LRTLPVVLLLIALAASASLASPQASQGTAGDQGSAATSSQAPEGSVPCRVATRPPSRGRPNSPCTIVYVPLPSQTENQSAEDACRNVTFSQRWPWLKCNYGPVGALASICSALLAFLIGVLAYRLNRTVRRGQISNDQVKTLLEIDDALIADPALWVVHGPKYTPSKAPALDELKNIIVDMGTAGTKAKADKALAILAAGGWTDDSKFEYKKLAFLSRYFNFFESLYWNYGRHWYLHTWPFGSKAEWDAWYNYICDFMDKNADAKARWNIVATEHIYTKSFTEFMNKVVARP
jgi:hypothetical protein